MVADVMEQMAGIESVRVNVRVQSVTIEFSPERTSERQVLDALSELPWDSVEDIEYEPELTLTDLSLNATALAASALLPADLKPLIAIPTITPTVWHGYNSLLDEGLNSDVLDAMALSLSAGRGDYGTAVLTQNLLTLGEFMEQKTSHKADELLARMMRPDTQQLWVERDGAEIQLSSTALQEGDLMLLGPGDSISADGEVADGVGLVNQSSMTGESIPVRKEPDDWCYAGTVIQEGNLKIRAVKVGDMTSTARIAQFIQDSIKQQSQTQQVTNDMADRRVKITLGVGGLVYALTRDLNRLAAVFLVDYACALKLSTPLSFKNAMHCAAQSGLILKGGHAIEKLAEVDTCVFDKTGTLTYGQMQVTDVIDLRKDDSGHDLLHLAASIEEHSNHPLAHAIVAAARNESFDHVDHGDVEYIVAHGLSSTYNGGSKLIIGSRHYLEQHEQIDFSQHEDIIESLYVRGLHQMYMADDSKLIGIVALRDRLRPEAKEVLGLLRELGINKLVLLTGDGHTKGQAMAEELAMDQAFTEMHPEDKSDVIKQLKAQGNKVMFVGDGVNDAPALAEADLGVSMCQGTELTQQAADLLMLNDDLHGLVTAKQLSLRTMELIRSNITLTEVINTGIMAGAAFGFISPVASALLHNGTTLGILLRALNKKPITPVNQ